VNSAYEATEDADALLILTDWAEFGSLDLAKVRKSLRYSILVDGRNMYDPATVAEAGITYYSVGRPAAHPVRETVTA
ncbi:MAG: UDP-glucose/GDP-mannose dehydrogenase family protein, partial [Terriglobus sp.]